MLPDTFDLAELSDRAGVSVRTIRYYIQQGLLPSPEARGPGTRYEREHLDRLKLIRRLQREHLPLAEIRRRMEKLDAGAIRELLDRGPDRVPGSSAKDYIREVLSGGAVMMAAAAPRPSGPGPRAQSAPAAGNPARSQWDRIALAPDIELHIRRPLSREQNRQVDRLLDAARRIFEEDVP